MKKRYLLAAAFAACLLISGNSFAADLKVSQDTSTGEVTFTGTTFEFQASSSVTITGGIANLGQHFAIGAWHNSTLNKKHGKAYAMTDETGGMYFQDINTLTAGPAISTYNSTVLNGTGSKWSVVGASTSTSSDS